MTGSGSIEAPCPVLSIFRSVVHCCPFALTNCLGSIHILLRLRLSSNVSVDESWALPGFGRDGPRRRCYRLLRATGLADEQVELCLCQARADQPFAPVHGEQDVMPAAGEERMDPISAKSDPKLRNIIAYVNSGKKKRSAGPRWKSFRCARKGICFHPLCVM